MKRSHKDYGCNTSFLDLLFNMLLAFVAMFILSFAMINITKTNKNFESKAEFIITITWPNDFDDDIDVYLQDPDKHLVMFKRKEDGLMHLDRDDLGFTNDVIETINGPIKYDENREILTIRGIVSGEYTLNIHAYRKKDQRPTPVNIKIDKINPLFKTVFSKQITISKEGEEKTVTRFTLDKKGEIISVNNLQKSLTKAFHEQQVPMPQQNNQPRIPPVQNPFAPEVK